ncbi:uncharacterized protein A4U43_C07F27560 [Asparagus officinalis]|uniref:MalT-like TPR region domain-containing protein n=1 Tax=Asparagus officinalis TaxID=4686 RepID=A0A5P1EFB0_ASPOF|nr:uncharacterized protein LOC109849903 [Asparagus officinalis]ONK64578.1 uncharacterized protein A4U43_C07F27560 [Asparagus officinalis]
MFQFALRRAATGTGSLASRFYTTGSRSDAPHHERVARQMIRYALGHARSQKSGESYAQAMMILEQGRSNLEGGGDTENARELFMLAMSTLLYERGEIGDALEKLQMVRQSERASHTLKVAAAEGLVGLNLEAGEDSTSSALADDCLQLLSNSEGIVKLRAKAVKGLVHLALGELKSAETFFDGCQDCSLEDHKDQMGNASLSNGVFLHATGNFSEAKNIYDRLIHVFELEDIAESSYLASANMVPGEVLLGATCALGQLLSQSGKFGEAEDILTKALTKAEEHFGPMHPKVGVVLTCIATMFKHKAKLEASSAILIQEGLYRKAIELLKAPALDSEAANKQVARGDIVALARGGYADVLCIQQNRKAEGERMRNWAEATWKNRRLSLAQALEFSEPTQAAVIDTRICRVV